MHKIQGRKEIVLNASSALLFPQSCFLANAIQPAAKIDNVSFVIMFLANIGSKKKKRFIQNSLQFESKGYYDKFFHSICISTGPTP